MLNYSLSTEEPTVVYIDAPQHFTSSDPEFCPVSSFSLKTSDIDPWDVFLYNPSEDLLQNIHFHNNTHLQINPRVVGNFSLFIRGISIGEVVSFKQVNLNISGPFVEPFVFEPSWVVEEIIVEEPIPEELPPVVEPEPTPEPVVEEPKYKNPFKRVRETTSDWKPECDPYFYDTE